jgi:uncharacterized protein
LQNKKNKLTLQKIILNFDLKYNTMRLVRTKLFETVTSKVKHTAQSFDPNSQVILFGSRARGDYRKESDWDFLILTDRPVNEKIKEEIREKIYETELDTEQLIFSLVENNKEWLNLRNTDLFLNIKDEGIKL